MVSAVEGVETENTVEESATLEEVEEQIEEVVTTEVEEESPNNT